MSKDFKSNKQDLSYVELWYCNAPDHQQTTATTPEFGYKTSGCNVLKSHVLRIMRITFLGGDTILTI